MKKVIKNPQYDSSESEDWIIDVFFFLFFNNTYIIYQIIYNFKYGIINTIHLIRKGATL
jgi:hypothetical protein